jgi:hypothetical protein
VSRRDGEASAGAARITVGSLPLDVAAVIQWRSALRTALFFLVAASGVASLVLVLPVGQYYATVDYASGNFDIEVIALLSRSQLEQLKAVPSVARVASFLAIEPATISREGRGVSPAKVYLTDDPGEIANSWFSDSTVISTGTVGDDWLDVSADVARQLGAGPGDWVSVPFASGEYRAQIRRILAVARDRIPFVAVGPRTPEVTQLLPGDVRDAVTVSLLGISGSQSDVVTRLRDILDPDRTVVRTRSEALAAADTDPLRDMPILLVITLLGLATLVGLAIREGGLMVARRRIDLSVLAALGASPNRLALSFGAVEAAFVIPALIGAYIVVSRLSFEWLFAAALPPPFRVPLLAALIFGGLCYLGALAAATIWHLSRVRVVEVLTAGTAR